jgi:general secretion pathway protein D
VKTTLLILFLSGFGLWAQTPPAAEADDAASRDEILRRAVREAISAGAGSTTASNSSVAQALAANALSNATANAVTSNAPAPAQVQTPTTPPPVTAASAPTPAPIAPNPSSPAAATAPASVQTAPNLSPGNPATPPPPPNTNTAGRRFMRNPLNATQPGTTAGAPAAPSAPGAQPGLPAPLAAVPTAIPAQPRPAEPIIPAGQINFPAVDINQVLEVYAELVGRTVLRPSALPGGVITLKTQTPLTKTEAIQALDSVLALNGITMIPVGDKFVKALPEGQVMTAAAKPTAAKAEDLPEAGEFVSRTVSVKYAKPSELQPVLQAFSKIPNSILAVDASGILIIRDYAENVKRMLELISQLDVTVPLDYISQVIPIKYALASDIASALGSLGGGGGSTSIGQHAGGTTGSRLSTPGQGLGGAGTSPFGGGMQGQPGYQQPGALGAPGANAQGARTTSFQDRLQQIVKRASASGEFQVLGQTKIIADERTNSLLVFASPQDMAMITNIIGKLDVVLAQVLIEAIVMEVNLSKDKQVGFSYLQTSPSQVGNGNSFTGIGAINNNGFLTPGSFAGAGGSGTNGAGALASGFSYLANLGGKFDVTLTAAESDDRINILSRPRIQTSHAVPASIQIGDTVPYITGTYYNGVTASPSSQYQQTFVGINLQVTPLINPDGLVVMDITTDIQQISGSTVIDGNSVPTTSKRTAQAKVSVKDRETVILGGFISTNKEKTKSGVPYLKDLPGIGFLFSSIADTYKRTELILMLRPTVLPTPEAAAQIAVTERNKMGVIKSAEAEYQQDQHNSQKAADKVKLPNDKDW